MSTRFDVEIKLHGHTLRVTGTDTPYVPATGPTMAHAGGDPAEGGELEDLEVFMFHRRKAGGYSQRLVCAGLVEAWEKTTDLTDNVKEQIADDWAAANGPQD